MFALWDRLFNVLRTTPYVLDPIAAAATHTVSRQPATAGFLEVRVYGGTSNTGTVTITGTVDGVPGATDALVFAGAGYKTSTKRFTAVSAVATTGLADEAAVPTIEAKAVGGSGDPISSTATVMSNVPGVVEPYQQKWDPSKASPMAETGTAKLKMPWLDVFLPRVGDRFVDAVSGETWEVMGGVGPERGRIRPREWDLLVAQRQA